MNEKYPIAQEGFWYLLVTLGASLAFFCLGSTSVALLGVLLSFYIAFFFRNPQRSIPRLSDAVLAPADGKIIFVGPAHEREFLNESRTKVSIFMSLFDVHINRSPFDGVVERVCHHPGRFLAAFDDRASEENERNSVLLRSDQGDTFVVVQIAGLVARRIRFYPKEGSRLKKGQRFGLIQFGSRVDIYLPANAQTLVRVGERTRGGETILAKLVHGGLNA